MLVVLALVTLLLVGTSTAATKTINVPGLGDFVGNIRTGCNEYLGIKFAEAPRFEDPVDVSPWPDPYDATAKGPMCYQSCPSFPENVCQPEGISENCLYLNIFTPTGNPSGRCVMVFFHGGNFRSYSGGSLLYDGEAFVQTGGCILVTINYRLTMFGFLGSRNTGVKDQIKALEWIHTYIQYFGGDPAKITIFGQSAGAQSVALMMSIPSASQYFNRAILHSCPFTIPFRTTAEGASQESQLAGLIGCPVGDLSCYQSVSADDILSKQDLVFLPSSNFLLAFEFWGPVIDGGLVQDNLYNIFANRLYKPMETIIGTVANEGTSYINAIFPAPLSETELNTFLQTTINPAISIASFSPFYSVTDPTDTRDVLSAITTDYVFNCVSQDVGSMIEDRGKTSYSYVFNQVFPYPVWGDGDQCNSQVCHGIDLPSVFGTFDLGGYPLGADEAKLSRDIIRYWTNFAKRGRPYRRRQSLARWYSFWQLLLQAGNTRMTNFFESFYNNLKCQSIKDSLGFNPI